MKRYLRGICLVLCIALMCSCIGGCGTEVVESWVTEEVVEEGESVVTDNTESNTSEKDSESNKDSQTDKAPEAGKNSEEDKGSQKEEQTGSASKENTTASSGKEDKDSDKKGSPYDVKDLKGITLRRIVWYTPGAIEKKMVEDFEKKYNCNIEDVYCEFDNVSTKMVAGMASGDVIDIATLYGAFFPKMVIGNLFMPIDKYVEKSQLLDPKNPTAGGFDGEKMKHYIWGGHYYGFCSYTNVDMPVLFYNKAIFQQYGQKTPLDYVKSGNWNWDTFYKVAYDIKTQSENRLAGLSEGSFLWFPMTGVQLIEFKNGNPVSNLDDPRVLETMQFYKKCHYGNTALTIDGYDFFKGKAAMHMDTFSSIQMENASKSVQKNYEIAPVPCSKSNTTGKYPTSWSKAIGIGKGTLHADAVALYARWCSNYIDAPDALGQFTKAQQDRVLGFFKTVTIPNCTYGKTIDYAYGLQWETKTKDPAAVLKSFSNQFTTAIKDTISQ